jgi:hypothetical protein
MQLLAPVLGGLGTLLQGFDSTALAQLAVGAPVGGVIDLEQPIDVAVVHQSDATDLGVLIAGSAQLVDSPTTREAFESHFSLVPIAADMLRLRPREAASDGQKPTPCLIAPADNSASGRLICAGDELALRTLAPYLARTLARAPSVADLRVELFAGEGESVFAHGDDDPDGTDFTSLFAKTFGRPFVHDIASLVLEAGFDGTEGDSTVTMRLATATSPLTRALLSHASPDGPPPPLFERLPLETGTGWYARGADPRDLEALRDVLASSLRTFLVDDGQPQAAADAVVALLSRSFLTGGAWTVGAGHRLDPALAAVDAYVASDSKGDLARAKARAALQGWVVAGVDEPPQKWIAAAQTLVVLDRIKTVVNVKPGAEPAKESTSLVITATPASLGLPSGTLHVEARSTPSPAWVAAQRKSGSHAISSSAHTIHVFVVPDGATTWFALSENPGMAAVEVRASLSTSAASAQVKSRRDLDVLRGEATSAGGFLSIAELAMMKVSEGDSEDLQATREVLQALGSVTSGGTVPIPILVVSTPNPGGPDAGGAVSMRVRLPANVIADLSGTASRLF